MHQSSSNLSFKLVQDLAPCHFQTIMHLDEKIYTIAMQILVLYSESHMYDNSQEKNYMSYVILKSNSKQQKGLRKELSLWYCNVNAEYYLEHIDTWMDG